MATLTTKPNLAPLLDSITRNKIWNATDVQYYFGGKNSLALDGEFRSAFRAYMGGNTPDAQFAYERLATRAYSMIDSVTALDFSETRNARQAEHVLVSANRPNADLEGFFEFPGNSTHDGTGGRDAWSIGAFNSGFSYMRTRPEAGGGEYANWTVLHEIGHGLGLLHTHQEKRGLPALPTVGRYMNNERYSVMSYNGASDGLAYGHAVSFMALDVASIQALYGAETNAAGASSYSLMNPKGGPMSLREGDVSIGRAYYCIWDSGGEDTVNYEGAGRAVMINLNDATLNTRNISADLQELFQQLKASDFYLMMSKALRADIMNEWHHAGGFFSQVLDYTIMGYKGLDGGFSIANGAEIENAIGGNAGDLLMGNEQDNRLAGLGGEDTLLGSAGSDTLLGDKGDDWLDGGTGNDTLDGGTGDDALIGGIGDDTLDGGTGNDTLVGGVGNDVLNGGAGNDTLVGGAGDDVVTGGAGYDHFLFSTGHGSDTITDFDGSTDTIDLSGLSGVVDFEDLVDNHMTNDEVSGDVVITVGSDQLRIKGHQIADMSPIDFYFAF
ncbi:M10 family metallopeptidase C-terminal domain-containing protein [Rhizobium setariae]|nr:M10 family metallopeptidase C-terminal domain-containing protein [Rhizobium setariae]